MKPIVVKGATLHRICRLFELRRTRYTHALIMLDCGLSINVTLRYRRPLQTADCRDYGETLC